jgi:hypothetical protein
MRESCRTRVEMQASEVALAIEPMSRGALSTAGVMTFIAYLPAWSPDDSSNQMR